MRRELHSGRAYQIFPTQRIREAHHPRPHCRDHIARPGHGEPFPRPVFRRGDGVRPDGDGGVVVGRGDVVDAVLLCGGGGGCLSGSGGSGGCLSGSGGGGGVGDGV